MQTFDIQQVPRNPDQAVMFMISYILENRNLFYSGNAAKKTRRRDLIELLEILHIAAQKCTLDAAILKQIEMLTTLDEMEVYHAYAVIRPLEALQRQIRIANIASHFDVTAKEAVFSLDRDEIKRIGRLAAEMKSLINEADCFSVDHKRRLIDRVSQVESEIHKKEGRFDVILAGMVDFGDALGQFGNKVKPLIDRMREIRGIAQKKSHEYEKLPAPDEVKRLPPPDSTTEAVKKK